MPCFTHRRQKKKNRPPEPRPCRWAFGAPPRWAFGAAVSCVLIVAVGHCYAHRCDSFGTDVEAIANSFALGETQVVLERCMENAQRFASEHDTDLQVRQDACVAHARDTHPPKLRLRRAALLLQYIGSGSVCARRLLAENHLLAQQVAVAMNSQ